MLINFLINYESNELLNIPLPPNIIYLLISNCNYVAQMNHQDMPFEIVKRVAYIIN
jgi:hypothetical protein